MEDPENFRPQELLPPVREGQLHILPHPQFYPLRGRDLLHRLVDEMHDCAARMGQRMLNDREKQTLSALSYAVALLSESIDP